MLGSLDAPVALMVFSDFQCPFCRRFASDILPGLKASYVASGRVAVVFRNLPLETIHPLARPAAQAAECAASAGHFWDYHDRLFSLTTPLTKGLIVEAGVSSGLSAVKATSCVESTSSSWIDADGAEAIALGITGTPTTIIGSLDKRDWTLAVQSVIRGVQSLGAFEAALDDVLTSSGQ